MFYYILKILISAILIVLVSEISKRSSFIAAIIASLPILSIFAIIWLYIETKDINKISELSNSIFYLVIPSLILFISLPIFLKNGINFFISIILSCSITIAFYYLLIFLLKYFNIKF